MIISNSLILEKAFPLPGGNNTIIMNYSEPIFIRSILSMSKTHWTLYKFCFKHIHKTARMNSDPVLFVNLKKKYMRICIFHLLSLSQNRLIREHLLDDWMQISQEWKLNLWNSNECDWFSRWCIFITYHQVLMVK